jgi:hypothetical protein
LGGAVIDEGFHWQFMVAMQGIPVTIFGGSDA